MSRPTSASFQSGVGAPSSSLSILEEYRLREERLRALDAELNIKRADVTRRVEEVDRNALSSRERERGIYLDRGADLSTPPGDEFIPIRPPSVQTHIHANAASTSHSRPVSASHKTATPTTSATTTSASASRAGSRPSSRMSTSAVPTTSNTSTITSSSSRPVSATYRPSSSTSSQTTSFTSSTMASTLASQSNSTSHSQSNSRKRSASASRRSLPSPSHQTNAHASTSSLENEAHQLDDASPAPAAATAAPEEVDPETAGLSTQATLRFQRAKIQALNENVNKLIQEVGIRDKELAELRQTAKTATEQKEKLRKQMMNHEQTLQKESSQVSELERRVLLLEKENERYKVELTSKEKVQTDLESELKARDLKYNKLSAEMERIRDKYTNPTKNAAFSKEESVENLRRENLRLKAENKRLMTQRSELLNGFKKQWKLIDILKKQKLHLEAAKLLQFTEEEFAKALELGEI